MLTVSLSVMPTSFETAFQSVGAVQDSLLGAIVALAANLVNNLATMIAP